MVACVQLLHCIELLGDRSTADGKRLVWHQLFSRIEEEYRCPDGMMDFCHHIIQQHAIKGIQWYVCMYHSASGAIFLPRTVIHSRYRPTVR